LEIAGIFAIFCIQGAWPLPDVNEPYYLGKALHFWNPQWAAGDFFLQTADTHKVFYTAFGWLSLWLSLPVLAWVGRILTWALLAAAWQRLSMAAVPRPWFSLLSAALFVLLQDRCQMAGEWVVGGVEAKGFAYVLAFYGLAELIEGRWRRVWPLLGAAAAFHILVGGWSVVAAGAAWLLAPPRDRASLRSMAPWLVLGFLLSLPGLIPSLMLNWGTPKAIVTEADKIYCYGRLLHHLVPFRLPPEYLLRFAGLTAAWLVVWRFVRGDEGLRRLSGFVFGSLALLAVGFALNGVALFSVCEGWAAGWMKLYWFRLSDVAVPLAAALMMARWIADLLAGHSVAKTRLGVGLLILAIGGAGLQLGVRLSQCSVPPRSMEDEADPVAWRQACTWVAQSGKIPADACFITPDEAETFKWFAHRAEVVNRKEIPQDARSIVQWWRRRWEIHSIDGTEDSERWFDSLADAGAADGGIERLKKMGAKYHAGYVITVAAPRLPLPVVYENEAYIIYRL
jgi:hypothetical protein